MIKEKRIIALTLFLLIFIDVIFSSFLFDFFVLAYIFSSFFLLS